MFGETLLPYVMVLNRSRYKGSTYAESDGILEISCSRAGPSFVHDMHDRLSTTELRMLIVNAVALLIMDLACPQNYAPVPSGMLSATVYYRACL